MSTISNNVMAGVTLSTSGSYTSPLTITATGAVNNLGTGDAIFGPNTQAWAIYNYGTVSAAGASGIDLRLGGTVTNSGTGLISGHTYGVLIKGAAGTVTNLGTILATATAGVALNAGGDVTNGSSAVVTSLIAGGSLGIASATNITNYGTIYGAYSGIDGGFNGTIGFYGTIVNTQSGLITGARAIRSGATLVANAGTIIGTSGSGIVLIGNTSSSPLVINTGTIGANGGIGVSLNVNGTVVNGTSLSTVGLISGREGIDIPNVGTVINFATVISTIVSAINIRGSGLVVNGGSGATGQTIAGGSYGVRLDAGGTVRNGDASATGQLISGVSYGVFIENGVGTVSNFGTIAATQTVFSGVSTGLRLANGGAVFNGTVGSTGGLITGNAFGVLDATYISNFGTIAAASGLGVGLSGTLIDAGTIIGSSNAIVFGGSGANLLMLEHGYKLTGAVRGSSNAGASNTLELRGSVGGPISVNYNGLSLTHFQDVLFGGGGYATLGVTNTSGTLGVVVSGFTATSDIVDLTQIGTNGTIAGQSATRLTISGSGGTVTLQLDASDGTNFTTMSDGLSGTELSIACFCRGTLVLTDRGEVPVEVLDIGAGLVTRDGAMKPLKWIGRRSYGGWLAAGNPKVLPVCFKPGSLADGVPRRELWVSPEHALYLDGMLVPAELLVNGVSIVKAAAVDEVHYFHLELDEHDVILAEGAWAESFIDDDSRAMFHNAGEYRALYPEAPLHPPARYCAPRVEEGFELEALRRQLDGRAHRLRPDGTVAAMALEGHLDLVRHDRIEGWARDPERPDVPVALLVLADGAEIGRVVADRYRPDLVTAGIGDGCHAFELVVPGGLAAAWQHTIEVRRADDWTMLTGSPVVLPPAGGGIRGKVLDNVAA